jgi:molybdenum cofactor guanylyltransferase
MSMDQFKPPCLLLAGGQSRRMGGGAKFMEKLGNQSILARIISIIAPQVSDLVINSNMPSESFSDYSQPVLTDTVTGYVGPLAGVLTGLEYFNGRSEATHMLSLPSDAPFIPGNLVARLQTALEGAPSNTIVMAESVGRVHPVVALWPLALAADLRAALIDEELRKILVFANRYPLKKVAWTEDEGDPFFNINRPEDLAEAQQRL